VPPRSFILPHLPTGNGFATADATGQVMLWDTETGPAPVLSAAILPTGCKELVATDQGFALRRWCRRGLVLVHSATICVGQTVR
jgi:hypothetical protein